MITTENTDRIEDNQVYFAHQYKKIPHNSYPHTEILTAEVNFTRYTKEYFILKSMTIREGRKFTQPTICEGESIMFEYIHPEIDLSKKDYEYFKSVI